MCTIPFQYQLKVLIAGWIKTQMAHKLHWRLWNYLFYASSYHRVLQALLWWQCTTFLQCEMISEIFLSATQWRPYFECNHVIVFLLSIRRKSIDGRSSFCDIVNMATRGKTYPFSRPSAFNMWATTISGLQINECPQRRTNGDSGPPNFRCNSRTLCQIRSNYQEPSCKRLQAFKYWRASFFVQQGRLRVNCLRNWWYFARNGGSYTLSHRKTHW